MAWTRPSERKTARKKEKRKACPVSPEKGEDPGKGMPVKRTREGLCGVQHREKEKKTHNNN